MTNDKLEKTFLLEFALLKALATREHYENYIGYVNYDRLFEETKILLDCYKQYYDLYDTHTKIDFTTFLTQFQTNWHSMDMNNEDMEKFRLGILNIDNKAATDAETALLGLINKQFIDRINDIGKKSFDSESIRQELDTYEVKRAGILKDYDKDAHTSDDVDFDLIDPTLGLSWYLKPLQDCLGGLINGSLVVVNAASGIGKSAFLHGQVGHTLKELVKRGSTRPILWFNTEGRLDSVHGRLWSNMYRDKIPGGYRDILLKKNKESIQKYHKKVGINNLFIAFTANNMGLNYIRMKVKKYNPCLIILDMAAHIATPEGKNMSDTKLLENFFNSLRRLSSENCPVIATVQAGNGAKWWDRDAQKYMYKKWPTDDDIYGSKTAVQGSAETIITIGKDNDHEWDRYIQTTKVKSDIDPVKFKCELVRKYSSYDFVSAIGKYSIDNDEQITEAD